jgi:hypothetical protein
MMNRFNYLIEDEDNNYQVPSLKTNKDNSITKENVMNTLNTKLDNDVYIPSSLRLRYEKNMSESSELPKVKEGKDFPKLNDGNEFPSLVSKVENNNSKEKNSWGNNNKLSVIKYELKLTPVLRNKDMREDASMIKCYYGDCCKLMNKDMAKYHNKYGVNRYDRKTESYYYIETEEGYLSFSSPSKFKEMIDEMELNGEEPYFDEEIYDEENY